MQIACKTKFTLIVADHLKERKRAWNTSMDELRSSDLSREPGAISNEHIGGQVFSHALERNTRWGARY